MPPDPPPVKLDITLYQPAAGAPRPLADPVHQLLGNILWNEQQNRAALTEMQKLLGQIAKAGNSPMLTVQKQAPDGALETLKQERVEAGAPRPTPQAGKGTDAAGYAFTIQEALHPWGVVYVFCRTAQVGFFQNWGKAFARQGLEVRQYIVDGMYSEVQIAANALPPIPDEVTAFSFARNAGKEPSIREAPELIEQQARTLYEATRRVLAAATPKPLAACVWGHSEHWQRAPALACRDAGVSTLHAEGAMFPRPSHFEHGRPLDGGHAIINRGGQYYEDCTDIDTLWAAVKDEPLTPAQEARIDTYIESWRALKASKYGQPGTPQFDAEGRRVLFVPLQIDRDASLFYAREKVLSTGIELLGFVAECAAPAQWQIVAKVHPHDQPTGALRSCDARYGHLKVLADGNIHDLIGTADAVCGINSTVLLEACCYDKPAICLGSSCYTQKGFTYDVRSREKLTKLLRWDESPLEVGARQRESFRRFLHMMMWEGNGGNGFFVDIDSFDAARLVGG